MNALKDWIIRKLGGVPHSDLDQNFKTVVEQRDRFHAYCCTLQNQKAKLGVYTGRAYRAGWNRKPFENYANPKEYRDNIKRLGKNYECSHKKHQKQELGLFKKIEMFWEKTE